MFRAAASLPISTLLRRNNVVTSFASLSTTTNRNDTWQQRFEEVKSFIDKRGNLEGIEEEDPKLEQWIRKQRGLYQKGATDLREDRREKLLSLGVPMAVYEDLWEQQYGKLKEFKMEHGHTNVPLSHDEQLFYWVSRQRKLHKGVHEGGLNEDREERLRELDFIFDLHKAAWMEKYGELIEFTKYAGHCIVPTGYAGNPGLGVWVDHQRQQYNRRNRNLDSSMTEERIELLNAVDFCWSAIDAKWEIQFEELKEHVRINGHGALPPTSSQQLATWVKYQRKLYKRMQDGQQVTLTPERLQKLRSLGYFI